MNGKKPWYKRRKFWKWAGISYLAFALFGLVLGGLMEITGYTDKVEAEESQLQAKAYEEAAQKAQDKRVAEAERAREKEEKKAAEAERLANRTTDEKIVDAVKEVLGSDGYRTHKTEEGTLWIEVNTNAGWSESSSLKGMYMDTLDIAKIVREKNLLDGADDVDISFYTPLTDQYGNIEDDLVVEVGFTSATLAKINFKNVLHKNVPTMADYYWEHPLFKANK